MSGRDECRVRWTARFKEDYKLAVKRGCDIELLDEAIRLVAAGDQRERPAGGYGDHGLGGSDKRINAEPTPESAEMGVRCAVGDTPPRRPRGR